MVYVHDPFAVAPMAWRWGFRNGMCGAHLDRAVGRGGPLDRSPERGRSCVNSRQPPQHVPWERGLRTGARAFGVWGSPWFGAGLHAAAAVGDNVPPIETLVEPGGLTWM